MEINIELRDLLVTERNRISGIVESAKQRMNDAPSGSLEVKNKRGKGYEYYLYNNNTRTRKYLKKTNMPLIRALAQKSYDEKVVEVAKAWMSRIDDLLGLVESPKSGIYAGLDKHRQSLVVPVVEPIDEFIREWYENNPGSQNSMQIEGAIFTARGEKVRSKSEKIIADYLYSQGIPYVYEPMVVLKNGAIVYPDFLILDVRNRRSCIYEHFGKIDDLEYALRTCEKISAYQNDGWCLGVNFYCSMESLRSPLNTAMVERMLGGLKGARGINAHDKTGKGK